MNKRIRKEIKVIAKVLPAMGENGPTGIRTVNHTRRMLKAYQTFGDIGVANYVKSINAIIKSNK